jgi:peroxiredoxin Q/BCP
MGAHVLGVSTDDVSSHQEFAAKYHLPFPLLSDAKGEVASRYGALFKLGPLRYAKRHSFIIDPQGNLAEIYRDVNPKRHSSEVIARLATLMGESATGKE